MVGVTNFVFTLVSFWMIDRWGRKPLYVLGSIVMGVTLAGLTFYRCSMPFTVFWFPFSS